MGVRFCLCGSACTCQSAKRVPALQEEDWRARESAILALGAISEGCAKGLLPYLAEMLGMLLPKLGDARPLVRSITCWALSRYSHWLVEAAAQDIPLARQQLDSLLKVRTARRVLCQQGGPRLAWVLLLRHGSSGGLMSLPTLIQAADTLLQ